MFGDDLRIPRLCGRQIQRNNIAVGVPKEKVAIFLPFLDHIMCELQSRLSDRFVKIIALEGLIPADNSLYDTNSNLVSGVLRLRTIETAPGAHLK